MKIDCGNSKKTKELINLLKRNNVVPYLPVSEEILKNKFNSMLELDPDKIKVKIYFWKQFSFVLKENHEFKCIIDETIKCPFHLKIVHLEKENLKEASVERFDSKTLLFKVKPFNNDKKIRCKFILFCSNKRFEVKQFRDETFDYENWIKIASVYMNIDSFKSSQIFNMSGMTHFCLKNKIGSILDRL